MTDAENSLLTGLAAKYLWWITPDEALKIQERIIIQAMNIGNFFDVEALVAAVGEEKALFLPRQVKVAGGCSTVPA